MVEAALLLLLVAALRTLSQDAVDAPAPPGQMAGLVARYRERVSSRFRLRESVAVHADALGTSETSLRADRGALARGDARRTRDARGTSHAALYEPPGRRHRICARLFRRSLFHTLFCASRRLVTDTFSRQPNGSVRKTLADRGQSWIIEIDALETSSAFQPTSN